MYLYRVTQSPQIATIRAYNESGTVTVDILREFNLVLLQRSVRGVHPEDLERLCHYDHADSYRNYMPPEVSATMDRMEAELWAEMKTWHELPDAPPPGPERGAWIIEKTQKRVAELMGQVVFRSLIK